MISEHFFILHFGDGRQRVWHWHEAAVLGCAGPPESSSLHFVGQQRHTRQSATGYGTHASINVTRILSLWLAKPLTLRELTVWSHLMPKLKWSVTANSINEDTTHYLQEEKTGPFEGTLVEPQNVCTKAVQDINTLGPWQNDPYFAADIDNDHFVRDKCCVSIKTSQNFVPMSRLTVNQHSFRWMLQCETGTKPLPELVYWHTRVCLIKPQWVNTDPIANVLNMFANNEKTWLALQVRLGPEFPFEKNDPLFSPSGSWNLNIPGEQGL